MAAGTEFLLKDGKELGALNQAGNEVPDKVRSVPTET